MADSQSISSPSDEDALHITILISVTSMVCGVLHSKHEDTTDTGRYRTLPP